MQQLQQQLLMLQVQVEETKKNALNDAKSCEEEDQVIIIFFSYS